MAIAARKCVELCLLAVPEDAQGHETQQVADQLGRGPREGAPQFSLAVDDLAGRHVKIENQQRHRHSEYAVAERGKPLETLTGNFVVRRGHGVAVRT
jgi:hypothetical protein